MISGSSMEGGRTRSAQAQLHHLYNHRSVQRNGLSDHQHGLGPAPGAGQSIVWPDASPDRGGSPMRLLAARFLHDMQVGS